jgi:hypothetical protein
LRSIGAVSFCPRRSSPFRRVDPIQHCAAQLALPASGPIVTAAREQQVAVGDIIMSSSYVGFSSSSMDAATAGLEFRSMACTGCGRCRDPASPQRQKPCRTIARGVVAA